MLLNNGNRFKLSGQHNRGDLNQYYYEFQGRVKGSW